jgi:Arc/MetJ-type ribon-helix-helix transcriptional regulator
MKPQIVRTTIALPTALLEAADHAVSVGAARSRNELFAEALRRLLAEIDRAAIDASFAGMDKDPEYLVESAALERELDHSSWEAFKKAEHS